jgi:hypothetical protein
LRAFTSAVTIELTSRPEPRPVELMVPPAVLALLGEPVPDDESVPPVELVPDDEPPEEPLELLFVESELSNELKLLPDVALVVVIALPFHIPE